MRILCVCGEGNSRSPTIASLLRYRGHETLSVGVNSSSDETRRLLAGWADLAILTDPAQQASFPDGLDCVVWPIDDAYPRPFNPALRELVLRYAVNESRLQ